jgi:7,8-dihydroneopterin aldolase/epimerase/oxygenase
MEATIRVTGMHFVGRHGANPGEKDRPQPIDVDVEVTADVTAAIASDALADAVDYDSIVQTCRRIVTQRSFTLLEALAAACADAIMADTRVQSARVRVRKPALLDGATPEVELSRTR